MDYERQHSANPGSVGRISLFNSRIVVITNNEGEGVCWSIGDDNPEFSMLREQRPPQRASGG